MKQLCIKIVDFAENPGEDRGQYSVMVHIGGRLHDLVNPLSASEVVEGIRENIADWLDEAKSR